jgi:cation:H+ antiporter
MSQFLATQPLAVSILFGLAGIALLVLSADFAVKKIIATASYLNLSTTFMGMTVLSLATTMAEISAHLTASVGILTGDMDYKIASSVVLGSNIGSDVVQQTFILGLVAWLIGGLYFRRYFLWKCVLPMILSTVQCLVLGWDGSYSRLDGLILFASFIGYTYYLYWDERRFYKKEANGGDAVVEGAPHNNRELIRDALLAMGAMGVTLLAAQVAIKVTEVVVVATGIGGSFIGVVTLGVATAMPELVTALAGVRNKDQGVCIGCLIGSNITNPLVGIGLGSLISTYYAPIPLIRWDLPWEFVTGALLFAIAWFNKGRIGRKGAIYLMVIYFIFIIMRGLFFMVD